jgi:hypothetical protein
VNLGEQLSGVPVTDVDALKMRLVDKSRLFRVPEGKTRSKMVAALNV